MNDYGSGSYIADLGKEKRKNFDEGSNDRFSDSY